MINVRWVVALREENLGLYSKMALWKVSDTLLLPVLFIKERFFLLYKQIVELGPSVSWRPPSCKHQTLVLKILQTLLGSPQIEPSSLRKSPSSGCLQMLAFLLCLSCDSCFTAYRSLPFETANCTKHPFVDLQLLRSTHLDCSSWRVPQKVYGKCIMKKYACISRDFCTTIWINSSSNSLAHELFEGP